MRTGHGVQASKAELAEDMPFISFIRFIPFLIQIPLLPDFTPLSQQHS
ncbi:hypothetical protein Gohar_006648 [Gossypium harknessii]|uniref:Uncharacterized protein n=1 Tax=Gossypium harknessii TaxID=34285 RepID=A0A7J9GE36_9ROSI|nr:hypothetical protein [Gossypium harknessii]